MRSARAACFACLVVGCGFQTEPGTPPDPACLEPVGHDEDRDGVDDACDPCAGFANESPVDTDHDGVADDCDPWPGHADRLIEFVSFAGPEAKVRWLAKSGNWVCLEDKLSFDDPGGADYH